MSLKPPAVAGEGNVDEVFIVSQRLELARDVRLKVVPPQAKLLLAIRHSLFHSTPSTTPVITHRGKVLPSAGEKNSLAWSRAYAAFPIAARTYSCVCSVVRGLRYTRDVYTDAHASAPRGTVEPPVIVSVRANHSIVQIRIRPKKKRNFLLWFSLDYVRPTAPTLSRHVCIAEFPVEPMIPTVALPTLEN